MTAGPATEAEPADAVLVRRFREGDEGAFVALVDRHYADCLRYAVRMLGNRADAEEAVQDAFVRAHRGLRRYDDRDRFRAWLFRILVNRCRSLARRRHHQRSLLERYFLLRPAAVAARAPAEREGVAEEIELALAALPVEQREAFLLKHVEELSYEEMAGMTGTGVSALKMRVKRACDRLRSLLDDTHG